MTTQLCLTLPMETLWKWSVNERSWGTAGRWITQVGAIKPGASVRFGAKKESTEKPFFVRFSSETGRAQKVGNNSGSYG